MTNYRALVGGVIAVTSVLAFASRASALEITIDRASGNYTSSGGLENGVGGGEFRITGQPGLLANYNALATFNGGFETFCLEVGEHVTIPATYNASISAGAISGGPGAVSGTDLISIGTATLYSQFAAGSLSGYYYDATHTGAFGNRADAAGALQAAFWFLEQEIVLTDAQINSNFFLNLLGITSNANSSSQKDNANGAFGVAVLNLGASPGFPNQDQLVLVPDGGTTLLLLGLGLSGVCLVQRRWRSAPPLTRQDRS